LSESGVAKFAQVQIAQQQKSKVPQAWRYNQMWGKTLKNVTKALKTRV
jgi:hypothetical protein